MRSRANDAAILAGLFWCVGGIDLNAPQLDRVFLLIAGAVLLGLSLSGRDQGKFICWYAILIGASERFSRIPLLDGSDVLRATQEAIVNLLQGLNPYTVPLTSTIPPGSPLVYPPGELLWYLPAHVLFGDLTRVDTVAGILTTVVICIAGLRAGWDRVALPAMLYATWGIGAFRGVDGSNDVSAAFMVVLALAVLVFADRDTRSGRIAFVVSAVFFGWAVAFKQFAIVILPLVLRHLAVAGRDWRRYGLISLATIAVLVVPFLVWDPGAFLSQQLATLTFHTDVWGANLLSLLQQYTDVTDWLPVFFAAEILLTLVVFGVFLRARLATIGVATFAGCAVILVALLLARWTTQPYYAYLGGVAAMALALVDRDAREVAKT
ncbi:MAG TPA: hypothetical protein DCK98_13075 [Chloroflexi bacterium]|nr:hypothetical protein [Chloroflexota bacterium]HAL26141.1 hypothetical protein [Chloroflexota bacterium]